MKHTTYGHAGTEIIRKQLRTTTDTKTTHEDINDQITKFFAKGGEIEQIPSGVSGVTPRLKLY